METDKNQSSSTGGMQILKGGESLALYPGLDHQQEILELFGEYTQFLSDHSSGFKVYLDLQCYEQEIQDLRHKYGPPNGRLYLAMIEGKPAGCIALKPLFEQDCEMKRLYVRPEFRNRGLGRLLIERIVQDAYAMGYQTMYLDTLPMLQSALHLYQDMGFVLTDAYNESPVEKTLFLRRPLQDR